jgi:phosphoenolpyruvate-protein kinase (PTS system EI component)
MPSRELAERFSAVGMIRSEYLLREINQSITVASARQRVADYTRAVARLFAPAPVWYRTSEFTTEEANVMEGVDRRYVEADFMKGRRGLRRALELPAAFDLELRTVAEVARDLPNLHILVPFVRDADDFGFAVDALERAGWPNGFGSMVEIPSALLEIEKFVSAGATNLTLGLNDLTSLLIGTSRQDGDHKLHPSLWWAVDTLAAAVGSRCEWGIAGNLATPVLARAEQAKPDYVSLHYHELPTLIGIAPSELPDLGHVARTKELTRRRIARYHSERRGSDPPV